MVNQSIFPLRPPFVPMVVCARCGEELPTSETVAVVVNGNWDGFAHEVCPDEEGVTTVPVQGGLL